MNKCFNQSIIKKIKIDEKIKSNFNHGICFNNEKFYYLVVVNSSFNSTGCVIKINSDIKKNIKVYQTGYVVAFDTNDEYQPRDDYFDFNDKCLYLDPVYENTRAGYIIRKDINNVFLVEVNCTNLVGIHNISLDFISMANNVLCSSEKFNLEVIPEVLPKHDLKVTHWFYQDCIQEQFHYKFMSKPYMKVLEKYVDEYVEEGNNMIITPMFTYCLDTEENHERPTIQLVKVFKENDNYTFDFSLFETFVSFMQKHGIEYFEMSHLFTQWGARHCPKIIINENGKNKKCFGWKENSNSKEYYNFLKQYLEALKKELEKINLMDKVYFHISDEPSASNIEIYRQHYDFIKNVIPNVNILDAISDTEFKDAMDIPVIAVNRYKNFNDYDHEKWAYYCCMQVRYNVPNAHITMPALRTRILGTLLYATNARGFLQWGYNFWNTFLSRAKIDPFYSNDCAGRFPAGDGYLVYPDPENYLTRSIRGIYLKQSFMDYRIIKLHESIYGKEETMNILHKYGYMDFENYPHDEKTFDKMFSELIKNIRKEKK